MLRFKQVDVFTTVPFRGNPVAVVLGAEGLTGEDMQRIATWTNLSETTFVLQPTREGADYLLRIFTPRAELPFAGHPTIGSAHAAIEAGIVRPRDGRLRQECGAGVLDIALEAGRIWVTSPATSVRRPDARYADALGEALGARVVPSPLIVDVGPVWLVADLGDAAVVDGLDPDMEAIGHLGEPLGITGVTVFGAAADGEAAIHVRSFAPAHGVPEDPVCGSGNISVAAYMVESSLVGRYGASYAARQGMQLGRDGRVYMRIDEDGATIRLGGHAVTCVDGSLRVR
ncbi:MAG: PhzF family phenazine biosynthesis protein [Burkholderiales bacterium]